MKCSNLLRKTLKTDRESTATTMWVVLSVINCLKIVLCPFMPSSSEKLNYMLGFPENVGLNSWEWNPSLENLPPGQRMEIPEPLFSKFEDDIVEKAIESIIKAAFSGKIGDGKIFNHDNILIYEGEIYKWLDNESMHNLLLLQIYLPHGKGIIYSSKLGCQEVCSE